MNSVGELVETILFIINIADTNELAEAVESWRGASGAAPLPDDLSRQRAWHHPIFNRNWKKSCMWQIRRLEPDYWPRHRESGVCLNALPVSSLWTLLDSESFRVAIALMFVFLIFVLQIQCWPLSKAFVNE